MNKKFCPKITPGPWILPKNKHGDQLILAFVAKRLEWTEELKSLSDRELIFNLEEEDAAAILAIPEMLEVVKVSEEMLQKDHTSSSEAYYKVPESVIAKLRMILENLHQLHGR